MFSTPAAAYQAGQAGYAVAHAPTYTQPARAAQTAYEGYQAAHTAGTYGFPARQQVCKSLSSLMILIQ